MPRGQSRWAQAQCPRLHSGTGLSCGCLLCCFTDIHEFYNFTLHSARLQPPGPGTHHGTAGEQHQGSRPHSAPGEPQHPPQVRERRGQTLLTAAPG